MLSITLTQPWASLLVLKNEYCALKNVETRSWIHPHRGPLAIHASKTWPAWAQEFTFDLCKRFPKVLAVLNQHGYTGIMRGSRLPLGEIVGVRWLDSIWKSDGSKMRKHFLMYGYEELLGDFRPGRFAWLMDVDPARILPLPEPIPCKGAQKLWTVGPAIERLIGEQLGEAMPT